MVGEFPATRTTCWSHIAKRRDDGAARMNALSPIDPITLEVLRYRLEGIAEDMQATLIRVAFSPIVREGMDASAAIFPADGRALRQSSSIPLHLVAPSPAVRAVPDAFPCATMSAGDVYIVNGSYHGGT